METAYNQVVENPLVLLRQQLLVHRVSTLWLWIVVLLIGDILVMVELAPMVLMLFGAALRGDAFPLIISGVGVLALCIQVAMIVLGFVGTAKKSYWMIVVWTVLRCLCLVTSVIILVVIILAMVATFSGNQHSPYWLVFLMLLVIISVPLAAQSLLTLFAAVPTVRVLKLMHKLRKASLTDVEEGADADKELERLSILKEIAAYEAYDQLDESQPLSPTEKIFIGSTAFWLLGITARFAIAIIHDAIHDPYSIIFSAPVSLIILIVIWLLGGFSARIAYRKKGHYALIVAFLIVIVISLLIQITILFMGLPNLYWIAEDPSIITSFGGYWIILWLIDMVLIISMVLVFISGLRFGRKLMRKNAAPPAIHTQLPEGLYEEAGDGEMDTL